MYHNERILAGSTNLSLLVPLPATTTSATPGVRLAYTRRGSATVTATVQPNTPTGGHVDWSVVPCDAATMPELHRVDLPDAAFAPGAEALTISVGATGMPTQHFTYQLSTPAVLYGVVGSGTQTTTTITTGWTQYGPNQLGRRLLEFLEGPCAGQRVAIVGNSAAGELELAPPLTVAPVTGNAFFIH